MTQEEKRARLIALVIAAGIGGLNLLVIVVELAVHSPRFNLLQLVQVGWALFLAWSLWQGHNWARWFLILTLILNGLLALPILLSVHSLLGIMLVATLLLLCFGTAIILWRSRSVEAYFTRLSPHEQALFSIKDQDGV